MKKGRKAVEPNAVELGSLFRKRPLIADEIPVAMNLCFLNARELLREAESFRRRERNARAFSLAVLSLEELAKVPLLYDAAVRPPTSEKKWKEFWSLFRDHKGKQRLIGQYGNLVFEGERYRTELPQGFEQIADAFKQMGFYVDFVEGRFLSPEQFFRDNPEWVDFAIEAARERIEDFAPLHSTVRRSTRFLKGGMKFESRLGEAVAASDAKTEAEIKSAIVSVLEQHFAERSKKAKKRSRLSNRPSARAAGTG